MKRKPQSNRDAPREVDVRAHRKLADFLRYWMICNRGQCRRLQRCVGEIDPCSARHWPHAPEHMKVWIRTLVKALAAGHSRDEAGRIAAAAEAEVLAETPEPIRDLHGA